LGRKLANPFIKKRQKSTYFWVKNRHFVKNEISDFQRQPES